MKKAFAAILLSLAFAGSAFAVAPLVFFLASVNLHLAAGAVIDYFSRDVKVGTTPVRVYIKLDDSVPEDLSQLPPPPASPVYSPSSTQALQGVAGTASTKTFTYPTSSPGSLQSQYFPWAVSAQSVDEVLRQLELVPPAQGGGDSRYVPTTFSYLKDSFSASSTRSGVSQSRKVMVVNGSAIVRVTNSYSPTWCTSCSASEVMDINIPGVTCPSGYTLRSDNSICDLTDIEAAKGPTSLRDGRCIVSPEGEVNPFDPDCSALQSAGAFSRETANDGRPATVIRDPSGTSPDVTAVLPRPPGHNSSSDPGGVDVSQSTKNPDGSVNRQDISIDKPTQPGDKPKAGDSKGANYPNNPPPAYPGQGGTCDPNRGPIPSYCYPSGGSDTSGTGGGSCGGAGQPACAVTPGSGFWSGMKDALGIGGEGVDTALPELGEDPDISTMLSPLKDAVASIEELSLSGAGACPTLAYSFSIMSHDFSGDAHQVCDLLEQNRAAIEALMLFVYLLVAARVFLEA